MPPFLLEKARKLKREGHDYGKIRMFLSNEGYEPQAITSVFRHLDEEEVHGLYRQQQITQLKIGAFVSLVPSILGVCYVVYQYITFQTVEVITLLPLGFLLVVYRNYQRIKTRRFTTYEIMKEEKRKVNWRNNY